ncbi:MAG: rhodanese-like domain-containing protein [Balneola sp.]
MQAKPVHQRDFIMVFRNILPLVMNLESISTEKLNEILPQENVHVFDMNDSSSWQTTHIPGAQNLDPNSFSESDLNADKNSTLVFYCSNPMCRKAPNTAKKVKGMGFNDVRVLSAGITGWMSDGFEVEAA